tara:strand:- start:47 stop:409 length:363 start_codon:yes stop_codon:yes gene_type:complete
MSRIEEPLDVLDVEIIKDSHEKYLINFNSINIDWSLCPTQPNTTAGIKRYIETRTRMGGFLDAFFSNDLGSAISKADSDNSQIFNQLYVFMYNHLPPVCYGSKENVDAWVDGTFFLNRRY